MFIIFFEFYYNIYNTTRIQHYLYIKLQVLFLSMQQLFTHHCTLPNWCGDWRRQKCEWWGIHASLAEADD